MVRNNKKTVLMVDDDPLNFEKIKECLSGSEIELVCVRNEELAITILLEKRHVFSAVLLDMEITGSDDMLLLSKIKADPDINILPVIIQSAHCDRDFISRALSVGSFYYLTKPCDNKMLINTLTTAMRDFDQNVDAQNSLKRTAQTLRLMDRGMFSFKSLNEGKKLAAILANACPNSDDVVLGLTELMINAVEHGNLGIGYDEKTRLNAGNQWENEIIRRLSLPQNKDKSVSIEFFRDKHEIRFLIEDQGDGFDWEQYMEMSPRRVFDSHGRGIAIAKLVSFDQIEYIESGNKVRVTVSL